MGFENSMMTSKYRTGVVSDFSIVSKAVFYIFKEDRLKDKASPEKFKLEATLPVQINPDELKEDFTRKSSKFQDIVAGANGSSEINMSIQNNKDKISIELHYDIYDEYNIRTMDGLISNPDSGDDFFSDISLKNKKLTSLPELIAYSRDTSVHTLFKWGTMQYFGVFEDLNCRYKAFSRWGEPLKCDVTVMLEIGDDQVFDKTFSILDYTKIKSYEKASNIANRTALGLATAMR